MNNEFFTLLQGVMLENMAEEINKKRSENDKIGASAAEVFQNLPCIYETATDMSFGEVSGTYNFMPLQYKAMVMRLVAPEYCTSVKSYVNDDGVLAEAFLYLSPEDGKPVASGKQFVSYSTTRSRFPDEAGESMGELRYFTEELAKGSALSKAYEKFGIGSWFQRRFTADDNPDKVLSDLENQDKVIPEKAYGDIPGKQNTPENQDTPEKDPVPAQEKQETPVIPTEEKKAASKADPAEEAQISADKKQDVPAAVDTQMSLDEARAIPAPLGKAAEKGLTLGETEVQFPGNILWMYTRDIPEKEKTALALIARSNPKINIMFANAGVVI